MAKRTTNDVPDSVKAIYKAYPKKVARPAAYRAIMRAIDMVRDEHDDPEAWLLQVTREYAIYANANIEREFIPYPATWFNNERWADEGVTRAPNPWLDEVGG